VGLVWAWQSACRPPVKPGVKHTLINWFPARALSAITRRGAHIYKYVYKISPMKIPHRLESNAIRVAALLCFPLDCLAALLANPGLRWHDRQKQRNARGRSSLADQLRHFVVGALLLIPALPGFALLRPGQRLQRYIARRIVEKTRQVEEAERKARLRNTAR
jgi:hypothetical protein